MSEVKKLEATVLSIDRANKSVRLEYEDENNPDECLTIDYNVWDVDVFKDLKEGDKVEAELFIRQNSAVIAEIHKTDDSDEVKVSEKQKAIDKEKEDLAEKEKDLAKTKEEIDSKDSKDDKKVKDKDKPKPKEPHQATVTPKP